MKPSPLLWFAFVASCLAWGDTSLPGVVLIAAVAVSLLQQ